VGPYSRLRWLSESILANRAIALCSRWGWCAQEEVQPIAIIERSADFTLTNAIPWGAVVAQHIQGYPADQRQVLRRVITTRPTGIFAKLHIQDPVFLITLGKPPALPGRP
jgi:hypothetical protein